MALANVRVVGSNYSIFRWRGQPIAYLENVSDGGVKPYGAVEAIHPLGFDTPQEFAVPRALSFGTLSLTIRELWEKPVWQHLSGLAAANDILDVWRVLSQDPTAVTCQTIIKPPQGNIARIKTYHNVVVNSIDDSEQVSLGAMSIARTIGCVYTHATRAVVTVA